ncbi:MAG: hypothetical protein H6613_15955 [Ignavibacteriales bacterium]|nr:hypothetical protein [Ignavibacteriales bacterium]
MNFSFSKSSKSGFNFNLINNFRSEDSIPAQFEDESYVLTISQNGITSEAKTLKEFIIQF